MPKILQFAFAQLLAFLLTSWPAAAQCILCYESVKGSGARTIEMIKVGIYIMLIPTLFIFGAVALMVYRRRQRDNPETGALGTSTNALPDLPVPSPGSTP